MNDHDAAGPSPSPEHHPDGVPKFDRRMLESLVCPRTQQVLIYDADAQELISRAAHLAYPIRNGIPVMLVAEAREID